MPCRQFASVFFSSWKGGEIEGGRGEGEGEGRRESREREKEKESEGEREKGGWSSGSKENAGEENEGGGELVGRARSTLVSRLLRGR